MEEKTTFIEQVFSKISVLRANNSSFVEFREDKIVYRKYSEIYVAMCIDTNDNSIIHCEAIHNFMETLNTYFKSVREIDIIFNFVQVNFIVDHMFLGGNINETNKNKVLQRMKELKQEPILEFVVL